MRRNDILVAIIIVLIILIVSASLGTRAARDHFSLDKTSSVRSAVDDSSYRVHLSHHDPNGAADVLAEINKRITEFLRHLRRRYLRGGIPDAARLFPGRVSGVRRLLTRYNPDNIAENSPRDPDGDTSYTIDKGAVLAICLREKNPRGGRDPNVHDLHDLDTISFVAVHELSHIAVEVIDHPPEFWSMFKFLLEEATQAGILRPRPYDTRPVQYCGIKVDYNPLHDTDLRPTV